MCCRAFRSPPADTKSNLNTGPPPFATACLIRCSASLYLLQGDLSGGGVRGEYIRSSRRLFPPSVSIIRQPRVCDHYTHICDHYMGSLLFILQATGLPDWLQYKKQHCYFFYG